MGVFLSPCRKDYAVVGDSKTTAYRVGLQPSDLRFFGRLPSSTPIHGSCAVVGDSKTLSPERLVAHESWRCLGINLLDEMLGHCIVNDASRLGPFRVGKPKGVPDISV